MKIESIGYSGVKHYLYPQLVNIIKDLRPNTILDACAGALHFSRQLNKLDCTLHINDVNIWSMVLGKCYLSNNKPQKYYEDYIDYLNSLNGIDGWFTKHYGSSNDSCTGVDGNKKPFQQHNMRKLDSIRNELDNMGLNDIEHSVLLTSLILSLDSVSNVFGGTYKAYLSSWRNSSYNELHLSVPDLMTPSDGHIFSCNDIIDVKNYYDVIYLEPLFGRTYENVINNVDYSSAYHFYTTVIKNDTPELYGDCSRRLDSKPNAKINSFNNTQSYKGVPRAMLYLDKVLSSMTARHVVINYPTMGRKLSDNMRELLSKHGYIDKIYYFNPKRTVLPDNLPQYWNDILEKEQHDAIIVLNME